MMTSVLVKLELFAGLRRESLRGLVVKPWCWNKGPRFESRQTCVFSPCLLPSFSFIIIIFFITVIIKTAV